MNLLKFMTLFFSFALIGCVTKQHRQSERYQHQINKLSYQLKKQKQKNSNLRDENIVLRQLAGVPEPALNRVKSDSKKSLKVYSEKFLYSQVIKGFKKQDIEATDRAANVFLKQYPKSKMADNVVYYQGLLRLRLGKLAESLTMFDKMIQVYPKANKKPAALLGKGLAYKGLSLNSQAQTLFNEVLNKYPKTPESIRAKRELRELSNLNL